MASSIAPLPTSAYQLSTACVLQLNVSDGGAPKLPVCQVEVTERGITTDRQNDLKHHGGPHQALCLYAQEILDALAAEGHPIVPGGAGENITTRGLDWNQLVPGKQFQIGPVLAEFSEWAIPCASIGHCFAQGSFKRSSDKLHPGWSRAYAYVRKGGTISAGDAIHWVP